MKTRAAVAWKAGQPLEVTTVDLAGPKTGEVLVEIKATGVCHTDEFTRSGGDPEGLFPVIFGHEGAGVVVDVGPGVTTLKKGDHVIPLYTPECRQCKSCTSHKTNLCTAIRATQGQGVMPDGTSRFSIGGEKVHHYMGCSTFSNYTVLPEIALAKVREDAPFEKICYIGCGVTTGIGAVINTAEGRAGCQRRGVRARRHRPQRDPGRAHGGRQQDHRRRHQPEAQGDGREVRHDALREPEGSAGRSRALSRVAHRRRRDYSFECVGHVDLMRQALECCHRGWGVSVIIGVAGSGQEIKTRPFQLVTGRVWKGTAFGGARGRTDVPKIVDWYMDKKINIDDLITHVMPLEKINDAFDLMHKGESIRSVVTF
jgi:S-(hydroxymethyl)glutathione dehydrogenase/alcohol dehydrogenase